MKLLFYVSLFVFVEIASSCGDCKLFLLSPTFTKHYNFFPLTSNTLEFNVRCAEDAHILLSNADTYEEGPTYEFVLGTQNNTFSVMRKNRNWIARRDGPILDSKLFKSFKIIIDPSEASLTLIANGNNTMFHYKDPNFVAMSRFGFAAYNKNTAEFQYRCDQAQCAESRL